MKDVEDYNTGDLYDFGLSDCCGANVYMNSICSCCNDHCTLVSEEEFYGEENENDNA
jgi:hypothetical protein